MGSTIREGGTQHWAGKALSLSNERWLKRARGAALKRDRSKDRCRCLEFTYPTVDQWLPRAKAILDTNGIFLTEAQTKLLLNGFEGSGRKMMDWLEDTILDFTSNKSEFDQFLEARNGT